ncbi:MAG: hypothetical protein BIFFINMI_00441 [Phycisphaerae bacterium]|nr:hypothetical protein [Phycisphaerae bacterium]
MELKLEEVWDFHTDLRLLVMLPTRRQRDKLAEQLDLPTARRLGGVFSATGRLTETARHEQWQQLEVELDAITGMPGMTLVRSAGDLTGVGRQLLHAEGVYFVNSEADLDDLGRMWEVGWRSIAPMYNEDNALGGGARGDAARGLTPLGRKFCERAWDRGFMIDAAHANHRTQLDLVEMGRTLERAVHYSHGHLDAPARRLYRQRGMPRATVEKFVATGGVIGLTPYPAFVGRWERHMEEIGFLAREAPRNAALGSDFTGLIARPLMFREFRGAGELGKFADTLADAHGEAFARDYCGRALRRALEAELPPK